MWSVICVYVHAMIIFTSLKNVLNFIAQPWGLFLQMNVLGLLCVCGLVILPTPVQVSTDHSSRGAYPIPRLSPHVMLTVVLECRIVCSESALF